LPSKIRALGVPVLHLEQLPAGSRTRDLGVPARAKSGSQAQAGDDHLLADLA
jgi:hypothetical protein